MKNFLTYILVAVLAALCSKGEIPTPPEPVVPVPEPDKDAPSLVFSQSDYVVYTADFHRDTKIPFTVDNTCADLTVVIEPNENIEASITLSSDKKEGTITLQAKDGMAQSDVLKIVANGNDGYNVSELHLEKAFLRLASDNENISIDNEKRLLNIKHRGTDNALLTIETNTELDNIVFEHNCAWANIQKGVLSVERNLQEGESRDMKLSVNCSSGDGGYISFVMLQEKGADSFQLEREALIALYKSTNGDNWNKTSACPAWWGDSGWETAKPEYWCTDEPLWKWYGVELWPKGTKYEGHVQIVNLSDFGPTGTLPEELGDLIYMHTFEVGGHYNDNITMKGHPELRRYMHGPMPKSLGNLKMLKRFNIGGHHFEEELQYSSIKDLVHNGGLYELEISQNDFTGPCPEWLADMWVWNYDEGRWDGRFQIYLNKLEGRVPDKVTQHYSWTRTPYPDGYANYWLGRCRQYKAGDDRWSYAMRFAFLEDWVSEGTTGIYLPRDAKCAGDLWVLQQEGYGLWYDGYDGRGKSSRVAGETEEIFYLNYWQGAHMDDADLSMWNYDVRTPPWMTKEEFDYAREHQFDYLMYR